MFLAFSKEVLLYYYLFWFLYRNLESNAFSGTIPQELGNLVNLGTLWEFLIPYPFLCILLVFIVFFSSSEFDEIFLVLSSLTGCFPPTI